MITWNIILVELSYAFYILLKIEFDFVSQFFVTRKDSKKTQKMLTI